jgi:hypothetical protein
MGSSASSVTCSVMSSSGRSVVSALTCDCDRNSSISLVSTISNSSNMSLETDGDKLNSNRWHISPSASEDFRLTSSELSEKTPSQPRNPAVVGEVTPGITNRDNIPKIPTRSWHNGQKQERVKEKTRAQPDSPTSASAPKERTQRTVEPDDALVPRPSGFRWKIKNSPLKPVGSLDIHAPRAGASRWDSGDSTDHGASMSSITSFALDDAMLTPTQKSKRLEHSLHEGSPPSKAPKGKKSPLKRSHKKDLPCLTTATQTSSPLRPSKLRSGATPALRPPLKPKVNLKTTNNFPPPPPALKADKGGTRNASSAVTNKSYIPTHQMPRKMLRKQKSERRRRRTFIDAALTSILEDENEELSPALQQRKTATRSCPNLIISSSSSPSSEPLACLGGIASCWTGKGARRLVS